MQISGKMIENMRVELREYGWFHMPSVGARKFLALATSLGTVVHKTDVVIKPESQALVTSERALDFHTDHSMVDYVAWLCVKPADEGGETILADARKAWLLLDSSDQQILETVMLKEHAMFENDSLQSPLVSNVNGRLEFYYSFWLVDKNMSDQQNRAFDAFRRAVSAVSFHEFKMHRGDILIVDNSCILHGRRAIKDPSRKLKRLWISSTPINLIREEYHANTN